MNLDEIKCGTCLNVGCEGFVKCDSCSKWECFECITEDTDDYGDSTAEWFCVDCWEKKYTANEPSLGYLPKYSANSVVLTGLAEWDSIPGNFLNIKFEPVTSTSPLPQFEYNPIIVSPKQYASMMRDGRNIVDAWAESHRLHADMHAKVAPLDVSSVAIMSNPNKSNIAIFSVDMDRTPTHGYLTCNSCGYHIDVEDYSIVGSVVSCPCLNQYQNTVAGWEFIGNLHIGDTQTHRKGIEPLVKDVAGVTYCAMCDNESTHAKMDSGKLCYECRSRAS